MFASVISDGESRNLLAQICGIDEFLSLIEDFLLEGKLILCSEISPEDLIPGDRRTRLVLEGINVLISSGAASANLLVAGSVVFAAICAATDQIYHIYEASCRIFCVRGSASSLVLTMLHVFAHMSGGKYFTMRSYTLLMTVLRSLALFLEGDENAAGSVCIFSLEEIATECKQCPKCPFSEKAVPLNVVVPLLLEELQSIVISGEDCNEVIELMIATQDRVTPDRDSIEGVQSQQEDAQSLLDGPPHRSCLKNCLMTDAKSHNPLQVHLYSDLILLVELIAVILVCSLSIECFCCC